MLVQLHTNCRHSDRRAWSLNLSFLPEKEEPPKKGKAHGDSGEGAALESDSTEYLRHESYPNQHIEGSEN